MDFDIELGAYAIATHGDLAQEVIYLMAQAKSGELTIEQEWELVNKWIKYRDDI